ncbi:MAG TPA: hypothetical protein VJN67_24485 [Stellaceae bacterium]|nr:hypothetical protein [Stellaceae bacterium]
MRVRAPLIAAIIGAVLALTACTPVGAPQPAPQHDTPERGGGDHGGGGMM